MNKTIHLIADLHLAEAEPHLSRLLEHYLAEIAPRCQQLYVLGDLFEVWVGDDHRSDFNQQVIKAFATYSREHGEVFFMHGNRDFMLGETFAQQTGGTLLDEPHFISWSTHKIGLAHGDSLCTDDLAYQELRTMVRSPAWQQNILKKSVAERIAIGAAMRQQSNQQQRGETAQITDVNEETVREFFAQHEIDWLIHGHTHRPATHSLDLSAKDGRQRIVLADWRNKGYYLELKDSRAQAMEFAI